MTGRREFIGSLASFGALGCMGVFRSAHGASSVGKPNIVIGVVSDIHVSIDNKKNGVFVFGGEETFRKTLEWFRDQGVDGVIICGDLANYGTVEELEVVSRVWYSTFPDGKAPDGRHVEPLFICGNHDWEATVYGAAWLKKLFGETYSDHAISKDLAGTWRRCFNEDFSPVWRKEIKGYSFVGAHWVTHGMRGYYEIGAAHAAEWLARHGSELAPSRPFFFLQHPAPKNTCHGPWLWGHDDGRVTAELSKFRNAIAFSGHSHASISDERAIWQGAFTSIGAGSLKSTGLEYGDVAPFGRENDQPMFSQRGEDPYKIMQQMPGRGGHQGMLMRVFDDRIVFERRDFGDFNLIGDDWVVPLPAAEPMPFAFARRAAASVAPEFPAGAELKVRMTSGRNRGRKANAKASVPEVESVEQPVLEISIPAATGRRGARALDFHVRITGDNGGCDDRYLFAEGFNLSAASDGASKPTACLLAAGRLKSSGALHIEVFPRNSFGKAGAAISADFIAS